MTTSLNDIGLILLAGGDGKRFQATKKKQWMSLNGRPVLEYSLDAFRPVVSQIVIVSAEQYKDYTCVRPGKSRSESVENGLSLIETPLVIVHDSVRPYITLEIVLDVVSALDQGALSVDTAVPIIDGYLKQVGKKFIPISKQGRFIGQTPEGFETETLRRAFEKRTKNYQDEVTMVYDLFGITPKVVKGVELNTKITYPHDLSDAEGILKFRQEPIVSEPSLRRVLILGGSGGIGTAIREKLIRTGSVFWAPGRDRVDLSREFELELEGYDAVVHSAGTFGENEMAVNFESIVSLTEQAEAQNWKGNIVVLSSTAGTYGRPGYAMYSASKAALNSYIESRHAELAEKGIFLNAIAPARTNTELQRKLNPGTPESEMIDPNYVAELVWRYTDTEVSGHIVYIRKGLDT